MRQNITSKINNSSRELGALLLGASLVLTGASHGNSDLAQAAMPPAPKSDSDRIDNDNKALITAIKKAIDGTEITKLPSPDKCTFQVCYSYADLKERVLDIKAKDYFHTIASRYVETLDTLIDADIGEGVKEDSEAERLFRKRHESIFKEYLAASKEVSAKLGRKTNIFGDNLLRIQDSLNAVSLSLSGIGSEKWERSNLSDTQRSAGCELAIRERDAFISLKNKAWKEIEPYNATSKQPRKVFILDWMKASDAADLGYISASSLTPTPCKLGKFTKATHAVFALNNTFEYTKLHNWEGFVTIIDAGRLDDKGLTSEKYAIIETPKFSYMRLQDSTILKIEEKEGRLHFSKTAEGYGETSYEISVLGFGGGIEFPKSNVFHKINYLEVLAYFDNDIEKIKSLIAEERALGKITISDKTINNCLASLLVDATSSKPSTMEAVYVLTDNQVKNKNSDRVPVFIKLPDNNILQIAQVGENISFYKTAKGYGTLGGKVHGVVGTAGMDYPVSQLYQEISAAEVLAAFQNDITPVFNAVCRQARTLKNSVSPVNIVSRLKPTAHLPSLYEIKTNMKLPHIDAGK